jgi:hypothetical protein
LKIWVKKSEIGDKNIFARVKNALIFAILLKNAL